MSLDCAHATSLLPSFCAGGLEPAEREALEQHLAGCAACRGELAATRTVVDLFGSHPAPEELVDQALGELPPARAERVAAHLEGCAACREEMALLAASRRDLMGAVDPVAGRVLQFPGGSRPAVWRAAAVAASLIALVAGWGWSANRSRVRALLAPAVNVAVVEMLPRELVARGGSGNVLALHEGETRVLLVLVSQSDSRFPDYEIEVRDRQGRTLWQATGVARHPEGVFTLEIPVALAAGGDLQVVVLGRRETAKVELETYDLTVRR